MFNTISDNVRSELIEKKSKFIANAFQVKNKEEAENRINEISKEYFDAKHNCYAYIINDGKNIIEKMSDNGEPSGTAGMPILNVIKKRNLQNVLVIVTRYFGGILLGTGGLTRAYSGVTTQCIDKANIIKMDFGIQYQICTTNNDFKNMKYELEKNQIQIENIEYGEKIRIIFNVPNNKENDLKNIIENSEKLEKNIYVQLDKSLK